MPAKKYMATNATPYISREMPPLRPEMYVPKRRRCYKCGEMFDSTWAGHRRCDYCTSLANSNQDGPSICDAFGVVA